MFYLLHGQDTYRSRNKLRELLESFHAKVSGVALFIIDENNFNEVEFEELLKAKSLFDKKYVITAENLFADKDYRDFVFSKLKQCARSENIFIFLEKEVEEKHLEKFKKHAAKIQQFDLLVDAKLNAWFASKKIPANIASDIIKKSGSDLWRASKEIEKYQLGSEIFKSGETPAYNPFLICDAFAEKNKIKSWIIFQQALMAGIPTEEVFFKIIWQVKNLLMIKILMSAGVKDIIKESGLHAFVASKIIKVVKNFTEEELENYSYEMLRIYHEERRGESELPIEFEKFLITSG